MAQLMPVPPTVKVYYGRPILPDVSRVLACLYEKEIDFELVDMYKGQRMPAEILKLQATMRAPIPAFEDSNKLLLESRAICRYVAEKYADQGNRYLLGRDLLERGSIEQWMKTEEQSFNPPSWTIVFHLAFNPLTYVNGQDQSLIAQSGRTLARVLDVYEHRLGEGNYLAGDEFTLADLSHLPNAHYLANSEEWRYLFTSRKNVQRWWEKISSRHSWEKVVGMLKEDASLKNTSTAAGDVATSQNKSLQQQSSEFSGSSIQLGRLAKSPDAASLTPSPELRSKVGQPTSSATQPNSTMPVVPESKPLSHLTPQPQQGASSIDQPVKDTTGQAPEVPESKSPSETGSQPQQGDSKVATDPDDAKSKPQPKEIQQYPPVDLPQPKEIQQGGSPIGQPTSGTTQSDLGAPKAPTSQPQLDKTPQPQGVSKPQSDNATDPKTANSKPQPRETQQDPKGDSSSPIGQPTSDTTQSNLGADTSAPRAPASQPQLDKTVQPQGVSKPQSETAPQPQQGELSTDQPTKSKLEGDATDSNTQPRETRQDPQGDSPSRISQPASGTTQSKLGADASASKAPISQSQLGKTPQTTTVNTQSNLGEGTLSNPRSETSPQSQQQGDSTDQSKNTTKESNKGAGGPTDQSNQQENLETQKIGQADSAGSSATSNKPNAQSSGDDQP